MANTAIRKTQKALSRMSKMPTLLTLLVSMALTASRTSKQHVVAANTVQGPNTCADMGIKQGYNSGAVRMWMSTFRAPWAKFAIVSHT